MSMSCQLLSLGACAPATVVTNEDIAKTVPTSDEWIVERTGIKQRRRINEEQNVSDLGLNAAREALAQSGLTAADITHVVAATCSPDYLTPSVACIVAGELDAVGAMAFDIGAACAGFIYGLSICDAMLNATPGAKILFICAEAMTRRLNWLDRSTCVLFGDAAAACVLAADNCQPLAQALDVICKSDGTRHELITVGGGTDCRYSMNQPVDEKFFLAMRGRDTYKFAVRQMVAVCEEILVRNDLEITDIDLFVPHQANMRIIEAVGARLKIDNSRVFTNVANYGNTSAASIPLALYEARAAGLVGKGARVLVTAFGAGLTWGAALLEFQK